MARPILTRYTAGTGQPFRWLLLVVIILDMALIAFRVLLYNPLFAQRDALIFVLEPVILLLVYGGIVLAATGNPSPDRLLALRLGAVIGFITGLMWIANLALETFTDLSGLPSILSTAPLLLGAFVLWGIAGGRVAWQTRSLGIGVLTAIWGAMICVLIAITFGFILTYTSMPRLEQILATDADFLRSHWSDIQAFAIANSFDSGFSHLVGALLVGGIVGTIGGLVGVFVSSQAGRHTTRG